MSDVGAFIERIPAFALKPAAYKLEAFGWFLHTARQKDRFAPGDLNECFDAANLPRPSNIHRVLQRMAEGKSASLLRDTRGYRLSAGARARLGEQLPARAATVAITDLLNALAARVTDPIKKQFLSETLTCFKHQAYRASIVMAWNLAYSDVLDRILATDLARFNVQLLKVATKASAITRREDFEDFKESKILEVARGAGDLSASSFKILSEKLTKRNLAAHPSNIDIGMMQAEEVIDDLVKNILLRPAL